MTKQIGLTFDNRTYFEGLLLSQRLLAEQLQNTEAANRLTRPAALGPDLTSGQTGDTADQNHV
jgi:hypothetical protein